MHIKFFEHPNKLYKINLLHGLLIDALPTNSIDLAEASALIMVDLFAYLAC